MRRAAGSRFSLLTSRYLARSGLAVIGTFSLSLAASGCDDTAMHPLTLVSPVLEPCDPMRKPGCMTVYADCSDLGLEMLPIEVGFFTRETTVIPCPTGDNGIKTGEVTVQIRYQPGGSAYIVDSSYQRDGKTEYMSAGPFSEDNGKTPWRLILR
jgi:hypothetical protein